MTRIGPFKESYAWLSNMWPCRVPADGVVYSCTEIVYQALKFDKGSVMRAAILACSNGYEAKKMAKGHPVRPGFHEKKLTYMRALTNIKYRSNPDLCAKLLATGDAELVELNWWGDTFWGVDIRKEVGENHLGKILMQVREDLRREGQ